jgi:phosphatidate cytidylyltransferase
MKRIISGTCIVAAVMLGSYFTSVVFLVVTALALVGLWEFYTMIERKGVSLFKYFGLFLGAVIPVSIFFSIHMTPKLQLLTVLIAIFVAFLLELTRKETHQVVLSMSTTLFGVMYIVWCFAFILKIRMIGIGTDLGFLLLAYLLVVTKFQDIGAYLIGCHLGKTPFLRHVSPSKTLEGAIGGIAASVIASMLFGFFMLTEVPFYHTVILGLILGVISQLGDLFESLIKRDTGVKDSGTLIPGMGGVLDVIDSLIFAAPVFYFYLTMVLTTQFGAF